MAPPKIRAQILEGKKENQSAQGCQGRGEKDDPKAEKRQGGLIGEGGKNQLKKTKRCQPETKLGGKEKKTPENRLRL